MTTTSGNVPLCIPRMYTCTFNVTTGQFSDPKQTDYGAATHSLYEKIKSSQVTVVQNKHGYFFLTSRVTDQPSTFQAFATQKIDNLTKYMNLRHHTRGQSFRFRETSTSEKSREFILSLLCPQITVLPPLIATTSKTADSSMNAATATSTTKRARRGGPRSASTVENTTPAP